jgi:LysM repeat protein
MSNHSGNRLLTSAFLLFALTLSSCKSTGGKSGRAPAWDPSGAPNVAGSAATPPHNLPRNEYPFDAQGNYVQSWVTGGGRNYGHTPAPGAETYKPKPVASTYTKPKPVVSSYTAPKPTYTPPPAPKPVPAATYASHKVVNGDTLYSLSRRYGTTVAAIKIANGMSNDTIVDGTTLRIPK